MHISAVTLLICQIIDQISKNQVQTWQNHWENILIHVIIMIINNFYLSDKFVFTFINKWVKYLLNQ